MEVGMYSAALLDAQGQFTAARFRRSLAHALQAWPNTAGASNKHLAAWRGSQTRPLSGGTRESRPPSPSSDDAGAGGGGVQGRKLKLVLDLDNTLLQAYPKAKLGGCDLKIGDFLDSDGRPEMYKFTLPQLREQLYYVKFRPGVREFLSELHEYCDLAIHTNAMREYADVMLSILDPDRKYFGQRVAARPNDKQKDWKKELDTLFDACSSAQSDGRDLLILDDRKDVWSAKWQANLIQCSFYDFFESRKEQLLKTYGSETKSPPSSSDIRTQANEDNIDEFPMESDAVMAAAAAAVAQEDGALGSMVREFDITAALSQGSKGEEDAEASGGESQDEEMGKGEAADAEAGANPTPAAAAGGPVDPSSHSVLADAVKQIGEVDLYKEPDLQLHYVKELILSIAKEFQQKQGEVRDSNSQEDDSCVSSILGARRRSVLSGVVTLMTGFNKTETISDHGTLDSGPIHKRRLLALGAHVVDKPSPNLTHVVAMRNTTTLEVIRSQHANVIQCHPLWVAACEAAWQNIDPSVFEVAALLRKYSDAPPLRPQIDHWPLTEVALKRQKHLAASEEAKSPSAKTAASSATEDSANPNRLTVGASGSSRSPSGSPPNGKAKLVASDSSVDKREWLATGPWSDGAEVWSPFCHTLIRFDPIRSSQLVHQLRREGKVVAAASAAAANSHHHSALHHQAFSLPMKRGSPSGGGEPSGALPFGKSDRWGGLTFDPNDHSSFHHQGGLNGAAAANEDFSGPPQHFGGGGRGGRSRSIGNYGTKRARRGRA